LAQVQLLKLPNSKVVPCRSKASTCTEDMEDMVAMVEGQ